MDHVVDSSTASSTVPVAYNAPAADCSSTMLGAGCLQPSRQAWPPIIFVFTLALGRLHNADGANLRDIRSSKALPWSSDSDVNARPTITPTFTLQLMSSSISSPTGDVQGGTEDLPGRRAGRTYTRDRQKVVPDGGRPRTSEREAVSPSVSLQPSSGLFTDSSGPTDGTTGRPYTTLHSTPTPALSATPTYSQALRAQTSSEEPLAGQTSIVAESGFNTNADLASTLLPSERIKFENGNVLLKSVSSVNSYVEQTKIVVSSVIGLSQIDITPTSSYISPESHSSTTDVPNARPILNNNQRKLTHRGHNSRQYTIHKDTVTVQTPFPSSTPTYQNTLDSHMIPSVTSAHLSPQSIQPTPSLTTRTLSEHASVHSDSQSVHSLFVSAVDIPHTRTLITNTETASSVEYIMPSIAEEKTRKVENTGTSPKTKSAELSSTHGTPHLVSTHHLYSDIIPYSVDMVMKSELSLDSIHVTSTVLDDMDTLQSSEPSVRAGKAFDRSVKFSATSQQPVGSLVETSSPQVTPTPTTTYQTRSIYIGEIPSDASLQSEDSVLNSDLQTSQLPLSALHPSINKQRHSSSQVLPQRSASPSPTQSVLTQVLQPSDFSSTVSPTLSGEKGSHSQSYIRTAILPSLSTSSLYLQNELPSTSLVLGVDSSSVGDGHLLTQSVFDVSTSPTAAITTVLSPTAATTTVQKASLIHGTASTSLDQGLPSSVTLTVSPVTETMVPPVKDTSPTMPPIKDTSSTMPPIKDTSATVPPVQDTSPTVLPVKDTSPTVPSVKDTSSIFSSPKSLSSVTISILSSSSSSSEVTIKPSKEEKTSQPTAAKWTRKHDTTPSVVQSTAEGSGMGNVSSIREDQTSTKLKKAESTLTVAKVTPHPVGWTKKNSDGFITKPVKAWTVKVPTSPGNPRPSTTEPISISVTMNPVTQVTPTVYVTVVLRMSRSDFCPRISEFQRVVMSILSQSVRDHYQLMAVPDEDCGKDNVARRSAEISVDAYLTDSKGRYNLLITIEFAKTVTRDHLDQIPGSFKGKFLRVTPIGLDVKSSLQAEKRRPDPALSAGMVAGITVACIVSALIIAFIILQMVVLARRRGVKKMRAVQYDHSGRPSVDVHSLEESIQMISVGALGAGLAYHNPALDADDNKDYTSNPLSLSGLEELLRDAHIEGIEDEFLMMPNPMPKMSEVPEGVEDKNRYANVIPIQETRVPLAPTPGCDHSNYINANYVRGYGGKSRMYIATQAPMENTRVDFWEMVWQQQSQAILMLTDIDENGQSKCVEYWPDTEGSDIVRIYGDFHVQLQRRDVTSYWIRSALLLKNMETNLCRVVHHLWLTAWPPSGVPHDPGVVLAFLEEATPYMQRSHGPPVVHCSPGTGRTGTLLAIDMGRRAWELTGRVDVLQCVRQLREDRAGAVQTKEQYAFVYQALLEYALRLSDPSASSMTSSVISEPA